MRKYPTLTLQEALRGANLALENAGDLIDEATVLLEAERPQRAIALAILGMEELGKIPRMLQVQRFASEGRMKDYWRYFRDHEAKSGLNALVSATSTTSMHALKEMGSGWQIDFGRRLDGIKFRALYVDFFDGAFVSPRDLDEANSLAEKLISFAAISYANEAEHLGAIDPEGYDKRRAELASRVDALLKGPDLLEAYLADKEDSPAKRTAQLILEELRAEGEAGSSRAE